MAKNNMKLKYKAKKRERRTVVSETDKVKSAVYTVIGVFLFFGLMYLCVLGLNKAGAFEQGYKRPESKTEFSYEKIMIGNVFNRDEKSYLVLFDNYKNYKVNSYINDLIKNSDETVYKVDMSLSENASHISDESNKSATSSEELRINDVTLIKISKGKIVKYLTGSEEIESYLE